MSDEKRGRKEGTEMAELVNKYLIEPGKMPEPISLPHLEKVLSLFEQAYQQEQHIFTMGNGGSASHCALDLAMNTFMPGAPR